MCGHNLSPRARTNGKYISCVANFLLLEISDIRLFDDLQKYTKGTDGHLYPCTEYVPGLHQGGRYKYSPSQGTFVQTNAESQVHMAASLRRQGTEPYSKDGSAEHAPEGPDSSMTETYVSHGKKFTILTSETPDTEEYCIEVGDEGVPVKFPATVTYMEYNFRKYFESQVDLMARYRCIDCKSINCNKELEHWKWDFVNKIKRENEVPHGNMGQWYQTGGHDIDECDEKTVSACLGEQLIMYPLLEFSHIRIFNYYRSVMRNMMRTVMMNH